MIFDFDSDEVGIGRHRAMQSRFYQGPLPSLFTPVSPVGPGSSKKKDDSWWFNPENRTVFILQITFTVILALGLGGFLIWYYLIRDEAVLNSSNASKKDKILIIVPSHP